MGRAKSLAHCVTEKIPDINGIIDAESNAAHETVCFLAEICTTYAKNDVRGMDIVKSHFLVESTRF